MQTVRMLEPPAFGKPSFRKVEFQVLILGLDGGRFSKGVLHSQTPGHAPRHLAPPGFSLLITLHGARGGGFFLV